MDANAYYDEPFSDLGGVVGKFDFVMANPPFNVTGVDKEKEAIAKRPDRFPFGLPRPDNGNYLWIELFWSALNENGRAGFVMPTNLILGRVDPVGIARIGEEKWRQLTRHHLKAGDIVYGRRGDIGRKALIGEDQEGWLCGTGCIRLSVRNDRLSAIYLSHFLDLDSVKQNIAARAVGSTMKPSSERRLRLSSSSPTGRRLTMRRKKASSRWRP